VKVVGIQESSEELSFDLNHALNGLVSLVSYMVWQFFIGWERLSRQGHLSGRKNEIFFHFTAYEDRSALVSPVGILLIDCSVMLLGILTTLHDHGNQRLQLSPGVTRIVDMGSALY
jgi:hypothetical protein